MPTLTPTAQKQKELEIAQKMTRALNIAKNALDESCPPVGRVGGSQRHLCNTCRENFRRDLIGKRARSRPILGDFLFDLI